MLRALLAFCILSIAACISSPEVTLVDETRDAPVSPDGSAESIALVGDLGLDAGSDARDATPRASDGGVSPHPERDAEPSDDEDDEQDGRDEGDDAGADGSKGKPPKKKKP